MQTAFKYRFFSFLEVMIVVMILAIVMTIAMVSADESPAEVRMSVENELKSVFNNAAIRAQAFNNEVALHFKPDIDGYFSCTLKSKKAKSQLTTVPEDETEQEALLRSDLEASIYVWSGSDEYDDFGSDVKLFEYEELLNEDELISFYFYPDGEASGPILRLLIHFLLRLITLKDFILGLLVMLV